MKKLLTLLLLPLLLGLSGCGQAAKLSDAEIAGIVDAALSRGEIANSFYIGDLPHGSDGYEVEGNQYFRLIKWTDRSQTKLPNNDNLPELRALCESMTGLDDVAAVFRGAFVPELAAQCIADVDGIYNVKDGELYVYDIVRNQPLSLIHWQHEPLRVVSQSADKIEVELAGKYMLTGTETTLPLTLTNVDGQWLLDESFSPREYTEADFYHSKEELNEIIADAADRALTADLVWQFDCFDVDYETTYERYRKYYYDQIYLIDKENQSNALRSRLVKELRTLDDVKRFFFDAFTPELAQKYIDALFYYYEEPADRCPGYIELPDGLAVNYLVTPMPLLMYDWHIDDYTVWQDTADRIVFLTYMESFNFGDSYFALRLQNVDGRWYCDETFDLVGSSLYSWELPQ